LKIFESLELILKVTHYNFHFIFLATGYISICSGTARGWTVSLDPRRALRCGGGFAILKNLREPILDESKTDQTH
jgi:hypothetical protein